MKTLKKIKNIVIETGRYLAKKPLEAIIITTLSLVPVACKDGHDPIIPINQSPVISTISIPDAIENSSYSTTISADDPQADPITYSVIGGSADAFLEINSITGELHNDTPITDTESGIPHDITIKAEDDKGNYTEKTFNLNVINVENVTGNVKDVTDDANLSNIEVKIGSYIDTTDASGNYTIVDVQDGEHQVEINDTTGTETDYFTHKAGKLTVSKTKNLTDINFKIIPTTLETGDTPNAVLEHIADCIRTRYDAEKDIKKWVTKPTPRIYLREFNTGNPVPVADVDKAKNWILNKLYQVDPLFTYIASDIVEVDSTRPVGDTPEGWLDGAWNTSCGSGINAQWFNGNEIISGAFILSLGVGDGVVGQESTECVIGGGEPSITPLYNYETILDDPLTVSDYTTVDLKLWKIHQNRPKGNKDLNTDNNHDVNPSSYVIN